jgi:signal transduction histidine kinase
LQVEVILEQVNESGYITVSDQGKGFDAETVMNNPGLVHGLLIVQDRLNLLGCRMEVTSKPGEGTRIVIEAPMERRST